MSLCRSDAVKTPASNGSQQTAKTSVPLHMMQNGSNRQARVRQAVKALASSDAFIDLLIAELERSGAFE